MTHRRFRYSVVLAVLAHTMAGAALAQHDHGQAATQGQQRHEMKERQGHSHEMAELHRGQVTMTEKHHFETVFTVDGIRVYGYTGQQGPQRFGKATGTATLKFKDGTQKVVALAGMEPDGKEKTAYFCPMHPEATQFEPGVCQKCGGMKLMVQNSLFGRVDLLQVKPGDLKVTVKLDGLDGDERTATFTETFHGLTESGTAPHGDHDSPGEHSPEHHDGGYGNRP